MLKISEAGPELKVAMVTAFLELGSVSAIDFFLPPSFQ